jgi:hypothetical protein
LERTAGAREQVWTRDSQQSMPIPATAQWRRGLACHEYTRGLACHEYTWGMHAGLGAALCGGQQRA